MTTEKEAKMASNRVTPSPDEERYPLDIMDQGYSDTRQKKEDLVIGGNVVELSNFITCPRISK